MNTKEMMNGEKTNTPSGKKEGKFSKLILGLVVGGAVGSVLGVTLSDKDRRKKIRDTSVQAFDSGKKFFSEYQKKRSDRATEKQEQKSGFWFFLNKLFHGKK